MDLEVIKVQSSELDCLTYLFLVVCLISTQDLLVEVCLYVQCNFVTLKISGPSSTLQYF